MNNKSYLNNGLKNDISLRDASIQLFRVLSMISIIICHICEQSTNTFIAQLGQFFNVGVFCFLFISGYLYSEKKIDNPIHWLFKNLKKILIPMYVFMIFLFAINYINNDFSFKYIFIYFFNLQYYLGYVTGGEHLWFLTILMLCYLLIIVLKKIEDRKLVIFNIILLLLAIFCSFVNFKLGFTLFYLFAFSIGFMFKKQYMKNMKNIWFVLLVGFVALIGRLLGKMYLDSTPLYDIVIFSISHLVLSITLFSFIQILHKKIIIKNSKFLSYIDSLSFYIYITHNVFISKPFVLLILTPFFPINLIIALLCSYLLAVLIKKISDIILKKGDSQ